MNPAYADIREDEMRIIADMHRGACDDGDLDPADLSWSLVDIDTARLSSCMADGDWAGWLNAEIEDAHEDRADDWPSVELGDDVREPIVVTDVEGRILIWDGWHRTAVAIVRGDRTIPAIVGTMPTERSAAA
jgi:hypothetical protein